MALDLDNIRGITLEDLVNDAVERKDKEALRWLEDESEKTIIRKHKDGTEQVAPKPIVAIRSEYLKKYLDYKTPSKAAAQEKARQKAKERAREKREALFANAFKALNQ